MIEPLRCGPCYKSYLWGGEKLKNEFGRTDAPSCTAESWELAGNASGSSVIAEGELAGKTLSQLAEIDRRAFWGSKCDRSGQFPILVKLIDAKSDLSVQVHPSDATALRERGEQGKAEAWFIVDCEPRSFVYMGFSRDISKEEFLRMSEEGTILSVLNRVPIHRGDAFFIPPGTVHAIGAGALIAEVQQNSDTTFRIFDFDRTDADGRKRPLHVERATAVLDYRISIPSKLRSTAQAQFPGFSMTELVRCSYFSLYRFDIRTEMTQHCSGDSFQHVLCTAGGGVICWKNREYPLRPADSFFMPASLGEYTIKGKCQTLITTL